jgi:hypothetical protein
MDFASIIKSDFGKLFTPAWNKAASYDNAQKDFSAQVFPLQSEVIPVLEFLLSESLEVDPSIARGSRISISQSVATLN